MDEYKNFFGGDNSENVVNTPENKNSENDSASFNENSVEQNTAGRESTESSAASGGYTVFTDVKNDASGQKADNAENTESARDGREGASAQNNTNGGYPYGAASGGYPYGNANYGNGGYRPPYGNSNGNPYPYANSGNMNNGYSYPPQNDGTAKKGSKKGKTAFIVILVVILVGAVSGFIALFNTPAVPEEKNTTVNNGIDNVGEIATNPSPTQNSETPSDGKPLSASAVFKKVKNSSVGILVYSGSSLSSEGSGVIFTEDSDGKYTYIITCAHVISDKGASIMVQLSDGKEYKAQLVGFDTVTDIGVLRIEATGLSKAEIGDSSSLSVGEAVYAIGNPGGVEFANSFTNGMVSAIDRPVSSSKTGYTMECIQHTAAINPGNSGGALVNEFGQVIGINSMKIVADEYEGMGFSVPSSVFVKVVNEIIANGYVSNRPKLGITYVAASTQQPYAMYSAIKGLPSGTIVVYSISEDSAFKDTKVQKGDMITAVNGKKLDTTSVLSETIENSKVGDSITLTIVRLDIQNNYSAETFDVTVKLVENRGDTYVTEEPTTSQNNIFGGSDGSNGDPYDYFKDYFDRYFGGNGR